MRAFLMCAVLTVAGLTVGATAADAHDWHHGHYHGRPAVVVLRPAPVVVYEAPVVVAQPAFVPACQPAPVIVTPALRPLISLRVGFGR